MTESSLGKLLREQLAFQEQPKMKAKLDTTGLTGKDRILMLAEIIKAHEQGRSVQTSPRRRISDDTWGVVANPQFTSEAADYRIKPITKTYYVNLYPHASPELGYDDPWWSKYDSKEEAERSSVEGAFAVAVPVTVEE